MSLRLPLLNQNKRTKAPSLSELVQIYNYSSEVVSPFPTDQPEPGVSTSVGRRPYDHDYVLSKISSGSEEVVGSPLLHYPSRLPLLGRASYPSLAIP